jgi:hypothetical protein
MINCRDLRIDVQASTAIGCKLAGQTTIAASAFLPDVARARVWDRLPGWSRLIAAGSQG